MSNKADGIPEGTISGQDLAAWLGITYSSIRNLLAEAGLKASGLGKGAGYPVKEAIQTVVLHFQHKAEKVSQSKADDVARRAKAEADMAEIDLGEKTGELVPKAEMAKLWKAHVVNIREQIRVLPGLSDTQRREICEIVGKETNP